MSNTIVCIDQRFAAKNIGIKLEQNEISACKKLAQGCEI